MKLSILVPVYNEEYFLAEVIRRVMLASLPSGMEREIIIADDASSDNTPSVIDEIVLRHPEIRWMRHERNLGKGAAIRTAVALATGDIILIQDADLEYDPTEYPRLLQPILTGDADAVFGSRFLPSSYRRVLFFRHSLANKFLTFLSNLFTDLNLTDMETGYKVVRAQILKSIPIRCNRFGIEPELTAKLAKRKCRIYEVPISSRGRTYEEGKKITWRDGVKGLGVVLRFWIVDDLHNELYGQSGAWNRRDSLPGMTVRKEPGRYTSRLVARRHRLLGRRPQIVLATRRLPFALVAGGRTGTWRGYPLVR